MEIHSTRKLSVLLIDVVAVEALQTVDVELGANLHIVLDFSWSSTCGHSRQDPVLVLVDLARNWSLLKHTSWIVADRVTVMTASVLILRLLRLEINFRKSTWQVQVVVLFLIISAAFMWRVKPCVIAWIWPMLLFDGFEATVDIRRVINAILDLEQWHYESSHGFFNTSTSFVWLHRFTVHGRTFLLCATTDSWCSSLTELLSHLVRTIPTKGCWDVRATHLNMVRIGMNNVPNELAAEDSLLGWFHILRLLRRHAFNQWICSIMVTQGCFRIQD